MSGKRDLVDRKEVGKGFHPKWRVELNTPKTDLRTLLLSWPLKQELLLSKRSTFCNNFSMFGKHHPPAILLNNIFFTKWEFRRPTNKPHLSHSKYSSESSHGFLATWKAPWNPPSFPRWSSPPFAGTHGLKEMCRDALILWKFLRHTACFWRELLTAQGVYFLNMEAWNWR